MEKLIEQLENGEAVELHKNRLQAFQNEMDVNYRVACVDVSIEGNMAKVIPVRPATWLKKNI